MASLSHIKLVYLLILPDKIKVESSLFYQACDEIGLLVIQDMPALRPLQQKTEANGTMITILPDPAQQQEFVRQLELLVNQHKSYTSIFTWVSFIPTNATLCLLITVLTQIIYNEGWGQLIPGYPEFALTALVKSLDPSRLVDSNTGWFDHGAGDFSVRVSNSHGDAPC